MEFFALAIALAAFVLAMNAFHRTGDIQNFQRQLDELNKKIDYISKGANEVNDDIHDAVAEFIRSLENHRR